MSLKVKMADLLVEAGQVVTCAPGDAPRPGPDMGDVGLLAPGALAVKDGLIVDQGEPDELRKRWQVADPEHHWILLGQVVVPGLVDCHTHPIFAGSRVDEYLMRARGATYQEIMARGGGILSTVQATRAAGDRELRERTARVLLRMLRHGSTTIEAKSGYGLEWAQEQRQLAILGLLSRELPPDLAITFMGAHALTPEARADREGFIAKVVHIMLPQVKTHNLAEAVDVFCEEGAFTLDESRRIMEAARECGLALHIHAEEFTYQGAARMGAALGAASADHISHLPESDMQFLADRGTVGVALPTTTLFLGRGGKPAPARAMLDAGMALAVASDFNAGSCLSESLAMAYSLAVLNLGLTPEQGLLAVTVNPAHALGRGARVGSLEIGKQADFLVLELEDFREWPYHVGVNLVERVVKAGIPVVMGYREIW